MTASEEDEVMEDNTVTAMGVLNTLDTLLTLVEDHPTVLDSVENEVCRCIVSVFQNYSAGILFLNKGGRTSEYSRRF